LVVVPIERSSHGVTPSRAGFGLRWRPTLERAVRWWAGARSGRPDGSSRRRRYEADGGLVRVGIAAPRPGGGRLHRSDERYGVGACRFPGGPRTPPRLRRWPGRPRARRWACPKTRTHRGSNRLRGPRSNSTRSEGSPGERAQRARREYRRRGRIDRIAAEREGRVPRSRTSRPPTARAGRPRSDSRSCSRSCCKLRTCRPTRTGNGPVVSRVGRQPGTPALRIRGHDGLAHSP